MKVYMFHAKYWGDWMNEECEDATADGFVIAESYPNAVEKLEHRLQNLIEFSMQEVNDDEFVFIDPEDVAPCKEFFINAY